MRKFLLLLIFMPLCWEAYSQNQQISILSDEKEALSYSTVYINGEGFGNANKDGIINIPTGRLKKGDIISASYVGYGEAEIKYEGYRKKGYTITLKMGETEKITVYGRKETRRSFRTINHKIPASRASDFECRFVFDINGKSYCRGDFYHYFNTSRLPQYIKNIPEKVVRDWDESYMPEWPPQPTNRLYVEMQGDYAALAEDKEQAEKIEKTVIPVLQEIFYTASRLVASDLMFVEQSATRIRMTGEKGKYRTFLMAREGNGKSFDRIISSMVYVDVDTLSGNVVESRMTVTRPEGRLELVATYALFQAFRYPNVIEATYHMNDGTEYTVDIYDTRMTYDDKPHVFKKKNSVDAWDTANELLNPMSIWFLRVESEFSRILYRNMKEDLDNGQYLHKLWFRERLEEIGLINWVY